jgi:hypothetical protein
MHPTRPATVDKLRDQHPGDARRPGAESTSSQPQVRALSYELIQEQAEALHDAGLVMSPEMNAMVKNGTTRRALQGKPWMPPDDAA